MRESIAIDGSYGEGGGQILRTSLSLSCLTKTSVKIFNIRAKRKNPGLKQQHLISIQAAQKISQAHVKGNILNSSILYFEPKTIQGGNFHFKIGTAGSTSLVFQTILLPLCFASLNSSVILEGGTHNPFSPPFHYLKEVFLPTLQKLGIKVDLKLEKWGFYPKGGGRIKAEIFSSFEVKVKDFIIRGKLKNLEILSAVSNLSLDIAKRQAQAAAKLLKKFYPYIKIQKINSLSPGSFIFIKAEFENSLAGFSGLGEKGKKAEEIGQKAAQEFLDYFCSQKTLDPFLADQIVLYLIITQKKFKFNTSYISSHLLTNLWVIKKFFKFSIKIDKIHNLIEVLPS